MQKKASDILFSKAVRKMQSEQGTDDFINRLIEREHWKNQLSEEQMQFIQSRDSFYLATSSTDGMPYLQHRGGRKGFITVSNTSSLWFPDYAGNRQYITTGHLSENNRAFLFFMDYPNQRRLKLWGTASLLSEDAYPLSVAQQPKKGKVERILQFDIEAIDENCRQHIQQRYTDEEYGEELSLAKQKIILLTKQLKQLEMAIDEENRR